MTEMATEWEPSYGFCAGNLTPVEELAKALEWARRNMCAYGQHAPSCDCKYGARADDPPRPFSEQTSCPEIRELIHRLLHRPETLLDDETLAYLINNAVGGEQREEWESTTTVFDNGFGRAYDPPARSTQRHGSEADARRYKDWREPLRGHMGGHVWPRVEISLRRRFTTATAWEEIQ